MTTRRDKSNVETGPCNGVRDGADVYEHVLVSAGGAEQRTLMRGGDHAAVCAAIYQSPAYDLFVPALPVSRLSVNLTRACVSGCLDGEKRRSFEAERYSLFLAPSGASASWRKDSPSRHLTIYFHADALHPSDEDACAFPLAQPVFNASLPGTRQLVDQLAAELDHPNILSAEAADSLARLLLVSLARHLGRSAMATCPIASDVLARLRDYVMAHLSERILVADLALHAGLAPNRFAVSYREQTGRSPHQFVLALRLEHAAQLLRHSSLRVADVAYACGFANQQHLTNTMRRHLGTTPSRYRALRRSEACV
jgi:AraC family transcriptional regulator